MDKLPKIKTLSDVVTEKERIFKVISRVRIGDYVGPEYTVIFAKTLIAGQLAYIAQTEDGKMLVNFNGKEGPKYKRVIELINIGDKPAYLAQTEDRTRLVNFDGQEIFNKTLEDLKKEFGEG